MKPLFLSLSAFGPYIKKTELDFSQLQGRSFFLIHGATGAGKTTILDGICFALYGDASGEKREAKMLRSSQADLAVATEVTFTFSLGESSFRIWRSPEQLRPKKRGDGVTLQTADALLYKEPEGKLLVQGYAKVTEYIENLLGFKSSQFRQVMLLPQGEFRQLLLANSAQRQEIMETLFKTEFYRQIEERLKAKAKDIMSQQAECQKKQLFLLEEMETDSLTAAKLCLEKALEEKEAMKKRLKELQTEQVATQKAAEAARIEENLFLAAEAAEKEKIACDVLLPTVENARQTYGLAEKAALLAEREKEVRLFAEACQMDTKALMQRSLERTQADAQEKLTAECLRQEQGRSELRQQAEQKVAELSGYFGQMKELVAAQKQAELCRQERDALFQQKEQMAALLLAEAEQKLVRDQEVEGLQAQAGQQTVWQLAIEKKEREILLWKKYQEIKVAAQKAEEQMLLQKTQAEQAEKLYRSWRNSEKHLQRLFLEGQAAFLAASLQSGDPCPVCGATDHPALAVLQETFPAEDEVKNARKMAESCEESYQQAQRLFEQAQAIFQEKGKILQELQKEIAELLPLPQVEREKEEAAKMQKKAAEAAMQLEKSQRVRKEAALREAEQKKAAEDLTAKLLEAEGKLRAALAILTERQNGIPEIYRKAEVLDKACREAEEFRQKMYQVLEKAQSSWQTAASQLAGAVAAEKAAKEALEKSRKQWQAAETDLQERKQAAGFLSEEAYQKAAAWTAARRKELETRIQAFDERIAAAARDMLRTKDAIAGKKRPAPQLLEEKAQAALQAYHTAYAEGETRKQSRIRLEKQVQQLQEIEKQLQEIDKAYRLTGTLAAVATGKNAHGMTFQRFVLKSLLADVLDAANLRLRLMSRGQYRLQPTDERARKNAAGGLDLEVFDEYTGFARSAATLSGGETFMASLCLALGLADVVQNYAGGIHLDTILVDEGFGTLDPEALDMAIRALIELQKGGRLVGIISHVPELKERIDARLEVTKTRQGSSAKFCING